LTQTKEGEVWEIGDSRRRRRRRRKDRMDEEIQRQV